MSTKSTATTISIEQLKSLGTKLIRDLNLDKEPIEDLKLAVKLLDQVLTRESVFQDPKASAYFYDDFLGGISKSALKSFRFKNKEMVETIRSLCTKMTQAFVTEIGNDNVDYAQRMRYVLDPGMSFYREFGVKLVDNYTLQVHADVPKEWRDGLKKGDRLDVLKKETEPIPVLGWTTGTVEERNGDVLLVSCDGESDRAVRSIPLASREIAPCGSYIVQNDWREALKKGDIVDCMDPSGAWYRSTVIEVKSFFDGKADKNVTKLFIGYRTYQEDGVKKDTAGRPYQGWSSSYDEWIKLYSLRVQQATSISRIGTILCRKGDDEFDKEAIDDTSDILLNSLVSKEIYCIMRPDKDSHEYIVTLLNMFGEMGGFDKLLARFNNKEKPLSFELAYYYFDIIGIVWSHFHRKFAQRYIPQLQQAVINYFENAPDVEVRKIQKERFDKTLRNLENLLRRMYSVIERCKIMGRFELSMCTILLKSNYLQRRIDGLKELNDIVKFVMKGVTRALTPEGLSDWLAKHDIIDELLGPKKHLQTFQRSAQILCFMYERKLLDQKMMEALWNNTKDEQFAPDTFKVIKEIGLPISSPELAFFAGKIVAMPSSELCEEALDILYEPCRTVDKTAEQLTKYADMLAAIAFRADCPVATAEKALNKYADMVSALPFDPNKKTILAWCVNEMLKKNNNTVTAIKLIRRIINQYSITPIPGIEYTRSSVVGVLLKDLELLPVFFSNFAAYYKLAKERPKTDTRPVDRYPHAEQVSERIDFLSLILTHANSQKILLSLEYVYQLWEMLCESPVSASDSEVLYKFLKEIASDQTAYAKNFEPKEGQRFFEEKMASLKNSYEGLSLEAFSCIIQFFTLVNEHAGHIVVARAPVHKYTSYTSYSNVSGASYGEYSFTKKDENALPEVKSKVHPMKLNGTEIFWKIVQEAGNKDVVEKSRDFLNKLYTQVTGEIEKSASEIRGTFIETYLEKLATLIDSQAPHKNEMVGRMISLMMDMIDESERKGTGRLKSHSALLKGYMIDFVVHNNVTSGKTIPKKLEVQAYANTTVWELKAELGKYVESSAECIKMSVGNKELKDTDNGKTIGEFVKKSSGVLTLEKKNMDDIPKEPLLTEDFQLTVKAKAAFTEIYKKFANKESKMDAEAAAAFIQNTTGEGTVLATDGRIKMLFASFDKDNDGMLDLDGFFDFYKDAMMNKREDTVRQNLGVHGFRNDLKKFNEVQEAVIDISTLPRYILSRNPRSFDLLFRILDIGDSSAEQTWNLISRLTTNEAIYGQLLSLESAKAPNGKIEWVKLLDTHSTYRLLYGLQIIESFLDEGVVADPRKQAWRQHFIQYGGFEFLLNALLNADTTKGVCFGIDQVGKMGKFQKECLGFLGHILNAFVKAATYTIREGLSQEVVKAQTAHKKRLASIELEDMEEVEGLVDELADKFRIITGRTCAKGDGKLVKDKAKESIVDLKELFKAKPSSILYLRASGKDVAGLKIISAEEPGVLEKTQAESILKLVGAKDFWMRQLDLLATLLQRDDVDFYDTKCIGSALQLFSSCVLVNAETFRQAKEYAKDGLGFDGILLRGLLCPRSQPIREAFMDTLFFLCYLLRSKSPEDRPLGYVLKTLLANTPRRRSPGSKDCSEFFHLVCKLIDMYYQLDKALKGDEKLFEPKELLASLVDSLKGHRTTEQRSTLAEDKLLIGMMKTIRKILSHESELKEQISISQGLLHELFFNCLFPSLSGTLETVPALAKTESQEGSLMDAQKCKTKESRTAAYKLLSTLCKGSLASQSYLVKDCLEPLCRSIKPHNGWAYIPSSESRSRLGYSGIENLGCICYMNAMIQQFYMIPTFRYGLLAADDKRPPCFKKPSEVDDNVLHQLQKIFSFLELTERQDYNPAKFCYAFKDMDGKPTNTSIQQDAQEFLNLVFDRIENLLKVTPEKYLLQSVFGGKTCSQIICKGGCGNVRRNYEDFYNLSLGVKGFKSLAESLDKYISGETINEYYCESCMKKVDVVKRTCLHEMPNVLIIHLQRIIYNYDTQMNEKINSRLEFPKELCVEPYTVEGVEAREKSAADNGKSAPQDPWHGHDESYYQYRLAGVLVHLGMADAGHYYSYINTNRKKGTNDAEHDLFDESKDLWMEFNDSHIRSFDVKKLESECFGGSSDSGKDNGWSFKLFDHSSMKNAYMLVYERKLKTPLKRLVPKEDAEKQLNGEKALECENTALARVGQIYADTKKNEFYTFVGFHDPRPKVPPGLFQEVWEDNNNFLFERQIYSLEFFKFVQDIFSESYSLIPDLPRPSAAEIEASMTRIAAKVIYDVLSHAYYNTTIKPLTDQLVQLFAKSEVAANEFVSFALQENLRDTLFILTKCPDKDARVAVGRLLTEVVIAVLPKEGTEFMVYEVEQHEKRHVYKYKTNMGKLLYLLINAVNNDLAQNWPRFEQYFAVLRDLLKRGGDNMAVFMNDKRVIAVLIDFYLGADSPLHAKGDKVSSMGNRFKNPKFQPLVTLVCTLALRGNLTFAQPAYPKIHTAWKLPKVLYDLNEEEKKCLMSREFVMKTLAEGHATPEFAELIAVFCYESKKYSKMLAKSLLKAINEDPTIDMIPYFTVLRSMLTINDVYQKKRVEWMFGIGAPSKAFVQLLPTAKSHEQLKMGLCLLDTIRENVNDYVSALTYNTKCESLLTLLWRHRKSFEIHPIRCLLDIMVKSRTVFDYVTSLPPPTYQFAKYTDWIRPLVINYPNSYKSLMGFASTSSVEKNNAAYQDTVKLLGEYEKLWTDSTAANQKYTTQPNVLLAFPQPYLIGKPVEEKPLLTEKKEDVTLVVSEIVTAVYQSLPTGKENLGVPQEFLEKFKEDAAAAAAYKICAPLHVEAIGDNKHTRNVEAEPKQEAKAQPEVKSEAKIETAKNPPPPAATEEKKQAEPSPSPASASAPAPTAKKETAPWKVEATVLKIEIRNNGKTPVKVKVELSAEGEANFYVPSSSLLGFVEGQKWLVLHLAQKRNLGAGWGEFKVHWTTAIKEVKGGRRKADFESPEIDAYHYYNMSDDDDEAGGKECAPAGTNTDGTVCWNCKQLNNQKNEKCSRCGENLDVDNFYY